MFKLMYIYIFFRKS